jgi:hypothetical protein
MAEYADDLAALLDLLHVPDASSARCRWAATWPSAAPAPPPAGPRTGAGQYARGTDDDDGANHDATDRRIRRDGPGFLAGEMLPNSSARIRGHGRTWFARSAPW